MLDQHGIAAESALHRWHPIEEQRENPDVPVPQTEAGRQAGHQRLEDTVPTPHAHPAADPDDAPYTTPLPAMRRRVFASITIREAPAAAAA